MKDGREAFPSHERYYPTAVRAVPAAGEPVARASTGVTSSHAQRTTPPDRPLAADAHPSQILYIAVKRGAAVDQPRNLAKSVTVECSAAIHRT